MRTAAWLAALTCLSTPLPAQEADLADAPSLQEEQPELENEESWLPLPPLEDFGVALNFTVLSDSSQVVAGGVSRRFGSRALALAGLDLDLDTITGWQGASVYGEFQGLAGPDGSLDSGDIQVYSNIDSPDFGQLYEAWFQQEHEPTAMRLKLGKFDANTELAVPDAGGEFLHSSAGFSPTVVAFPTYPVPAVGAALFWEPVDRGGLAIGVFDGDPNDALRASFEEPFSVMEARIPWAVAEREGSLKLGVWHSDATYERFDGNGSERTHGFFAIAQQNLQDANGEGQRRWDAFLQLGVADPDVSEIERHYALGITSRPVWASERDDSAGLYISRVDLSDADGSGVRGSETAVELYYRLPALPNLTIQPDLQWIHQPSGSASGIDDAWVATLRLELSF